MKKISQLLVLLLVTITAISQEDALYSQFAFNKLVINPAYAGSREATSVVALYRHQWAGFEGAPRTATVAVHSPLRNRRIALGFYAVNDRLGATDQTMMMGNFTYRVPVGKGYLSFAMEAGMKHQQLNLSGLPGVEPDDPILMSDQTNWLPDFGAGAYFYSDRFFLGFSSKSLLEDMVQLPGQMDGVGLAASRQFYAMTGYVIGKESTVKFRPAALFQYVIDGQLQADLNGSFLFIDRLWVGASYRAGLESFETMNLRHSTISGNIEYNISRQFRIGYAYDRVLGVFGTQTSGSHEILIGMDFDFKHSNLVTPRVITPRNF